jgi:hypothetical protein
MGTMKEISLELDMLMEELPERVTAMKAVTYDVRIVLEDLFDAGYLPDEIDKELIMEYIYNKCVDDINDLPDKYVLLVDETGEQVG